MPKVLTEGEKPKDKIRQISLTACKDIITKEHYSHRLPSAVKLCFGEVDYGPPRRTLACCVFSLATGRWPEEVWELTRLVRLAEYEVPLTKIVSRCLGQIRQTKEIDLVLSFADAEEDHHGGVYQACSWVYDGIRSDRLDGFNIDGQFTPARTCNANHGTSSVEGLKRVLPDCVIEPHFDSGKHCYWKALSKEGMAKAIRLGLRSRPYPKPMLANGSERNLLVAPQLRKGVIQLPQSNTISHEVVVVPLSSRAITAQKKPVK